MGVAADEAGEEELAGEVDGLGIGWEGGGVDGRDDLVFDEDRGGMEKAGLG